MDAERHCPTCKCDTTPNGWSREAGLEAWRAVSRMRAGWPEVDLAAAVVTGKHKVVAGRTRTVLA